MDRKLWENIVSLLSVQAISYVLPLFTLPFLTRVLGPQHWGFLALAEGYGAYLSIVVEYGFGLSASREIAQIRDHRRERSAYLANVLAAQIALTIAAVGLTVIALSVLHVPQQYRSLVPLGLTIGFFRSIFPFWYFQGLEQVRVVSALNIIFGIATAVATLAIVRSPSDTQLVLFLRILSCACSAGVAFVIAYRDVPISAPSVGGIIHVLKQGRSLFLFKSIVSLYTSANVLLLGMIGTPLAVAWFAGGEKLCKVFLSANGIISTAFYPRISFLLKNSPASAAKTAKASVFLTIGAGLISGLSLCFLGPILVPILLGSKFVSVIPVIRIMSLLPPLIAASNVFGIQWMMALRKEKAFIVILAVAAFVNIAMAFGLVPRYGAVGMAASVATAEAVVTGGVIAYLRIMRLDPWTSEIHEPQTLAA